jgi:hypothetical protein
VKVIIETDGSDFSTAAIEAFCEMFPNSNDLQMKIVSVYETHPIAAEPFAVSAEYYQEIADAAGKESGHFTSSAAGISPRAVPRWRPRFNY